MPGGLQVRFKAHDAVNRMRLGLENKQYFAVGGKVRFDCSFAQIPFLTPMHPHTHTCIHTQSLLLCVQDADLRIWDYTVTDKPLFKAKGVKHNKLNLKVCPAMPPVFHTHTHTRTHARTHARTLYVCLCDFCSGPREHS